MKDKYNDNRLAEEFDLIVLTTNAHAGEGLPKGALGTLIRSYTGLRNPMYGEFEGANGQKREAALAFRDFRVLNERDDKDLSLILRHLIARQGARSASRA